MLERQESGRNSQDDAEFRREVKFYPSYDYRDDPDDQRGCGGVTITFILLGPLGAISADVNTYWMLRPHIGPMPALYAPKPLQRGTKPGIDLSVRDQSPTGRSVSSHCAEPRKDWWIGPQDCPILGTQCYGDTGYMVADQFLEALIGGGSEAAWKWLEECYIEWLGPEIDPSNITTSTEGGTQ